MKDKSLENLIRLEKESIIKKHGYFNSPHEFYAVLLEELQETNEELNYVSETLLKLMWEDVRNTKTSSKYVRMNKRDFNYTYYTSQMKAAMLRTISEAIQVIAVLDKAKEGDEIERTSEKI